MKIVTIIGARPQIIKAAALSRAIKTHFAYDIDEIIVHTGQHYDQNMSQVFFDELQIPQPDYNLGIGSGSHGQQTAKMIEGIEKILVNEKPDYLVLYGDTNSTLAGAIAAAKLHIAIAHIEAGLRSFNKSMPEEINRVLCDHCSTLLFAPTLTGYNNLIREGFNPQNPGPFNADHPCIYHCGDVMYDNSLYFSKISATKTDIVQQMQLSDTPFVLCTIHRDNNTDQPERLKTIIDALIEIAQHCKIVLPLHPRTRKCLSTLSTNIQNALFQNNNIKIIDPVSFFEIIELERHADLVITDSGGVQKESYFFKRPCLILRQETEWKEIVDAGAATITDADKEKIIEGYQHFKDMPPAHFPNIFGDGHAAEFICKEMLNNVKA